MDVGNQSAEQEGQGEVKPVGTDIKGVDEKMELVEADIKGIDEKIELVEADIKGIDEKIELVEQNIQAVLHQIRCEQDPVMKASLVKRHEQLGEDK